MSSQRAITQLLLEASRDEQASLEALFPLVYEELRRLAELGVVLYELLTGHRPYSATETAPHEYGEALEIFQRRYGESHYMSAALKISILEGYYCCGDYAQAMAEADKAFDARPEKRDTLQGRAIFLAPNLNKLGQERRAASPLLEAIEKLKGTERVVDLATLKSLLGESLTAQHRFAEAETVSREAYEVEKSLVLPQQYEFVATRQRLSPLYSAWGKPDSARRCE